MDMFSDLKIGTLFNTKAARYVKVTNKNAVVVESSVRRIGDIVILVPELSVIKLYCDFDEYDNNEI